MNVQTVIAILTIAVILFLAIRYIYKKKKSGNQCVGCPYSEEGGCHKKQ